eukprot:g78736.t1
MTALLHAAKQGNTALGKVLVEGKADLNVMDQHGDTALHLALRHGHFPTAEVLVAAGGDITARNKEGEGLNAYIRGNAGLLQACKKHQAAALLVLAASEGDTELGRRLVEGKAELNATDQEQLTALLHATKKGNMELAKLLLQRGAEPNAKDEEQMTPLLYAAECNHELGAELGRLLLESKAEHNAKNKDGCTAVNAASRSGNAVLLSLLVDAKATVNEADKDGETPAYSASYYGHAACLKVLITEGADLTRGTKLGGWTPAHAATWNKQAECLELLAAHGAEADQRRPHAVKQLFDAVKLGRAQDVLRLADEGVPVNTPDQDFLTPLHWAGRTGDAAVAEALLTAEADVLAKDKVHSCPCPPPACSL